MPAWTLRLVALAGLLVVTTQGLTLLPPAEALTVGLLACLGGGVVLHSVEALAWTLRRRADEAALAPSDA